MIKDVVMWTFFHNKIQHFRDKKLYRAWLHAGKPIPPPDTVKQVIVKEYAKQHRARIFIETGTYLGDMV